MASPFRNAHKTALPPLVAAEPSTRGLPPLMPDIVTARQEAVASGDGTPPKPAQLDPLEDFSIIEVRHPEMARAITLLWGYPEMNEYFDRIWVDDGFQAPIDPDAMSELMLLARLHMSILPQRPGRNLATILGNNRWQQSSRSETRDPWGDVPRRR